jgi:hypothetical protein
LLFLAFLEALFRADGKERDGYDGADWWNGGAGFCTTREEHGLEKRNGFR